MPCQQASHKPPQRARRRAHCSGNDRRSRSIRPSLPRSEARTGASHCPCSIVLPGGLVFFDRCARLKLTTETLLSESKFFRYPQKGGDPALTLGEPWLLNRHPSPPSDTRHHSATDACCGSDARSAGYGAVANEEVRTSWGLSLLITKKRLTGTFTTKTLSCFSAVKASSTT